MPTHPAIAPSVTAPAPATRCRPPRSRGAAWQSGPAGVGGADFESGTRRASRLGHGASRLGQPCGPSCTPLRPGEGDAARPGLAQRARLLVPASRAHSTPPPGPPRSAGALAGSASPRGPPRSAGALARAHAHISAKRALAGALGWGALALGWGWGGRWRARAGIGGGLALARGERGGIRASLPASAPLHTPGRRGRA